MKKSAQENQEPALCKLNENIHKTIIDNFNQAVILIDSTFTIQFVNQKASDESLKIVGKPFYQGENFLNKLEPDQIEITNLLLKKAFNGETVYSTYNFNDQQNKERWFESYYRPFTKDDGEVDSVIINLIEITHLKQAEKNVLERKAKYKAIVQDQTELICRYYPDGTITFVNKAYCKFFGIVEKDLLGHNCYNTIPESSRSDVTNKIKTLNQKSPYNTYTTQMVDAKGSPHWLAGTDSAIFNTESKLTEIQSVAKDITEQKRTEQELTLAKERAEESDQLKSLFLTNISHEIRTPLNAIMGFSELLVLTEVEKEYRESNLSHILSNSQKLLNIINDVIEISVIESKQLPVNKSSFDLVSLLCNIQSLFTGLASINGIELCLNYPVDYFNLSINSDENKIKQIISNLLSNAIKFSHSCKVEFGFSIEDKQLTFFVKDKGIGIPPEFHEIIFESFRQVDERLHRNHGGAGIGLAISKSLTELLGGRMWLKSHPDSGSEFYFSIPLEYADEIKTKKEIALIHKIARNCWANKNILIAEDEKINYIILHELLKHTGAKLVHVVNGDEAVKATIAQPPDIILMDIRMPVMGGIDATKIIRDQFPKLPIIGITTYAYANDRENAVRAGCNEYITKPVDTNKLLATIHKYLSNELNTNKN
jgi:PAS domain S-box-containing protein